MSIVSAHNTGNQQQEVLRERFLLSVVKDQSRDNPKIDFVARPNSDGSWHVSLMPFHSRTFERGGDEQGRAKQIQSYIQHDLGYTLSGYHPYQKGMEMIFSKTFSSKEEVQASFDKLNTFFQINELGKAVGENVMFYEGHRAWKNATLISQKNFN